MSEKSKDELIEAQKEVIGILFEIIKRLQTNSDLDEEYFQIIANEKSKCSSTKLNDVSSTVRAG